MKYFEIILLFLAISATSITLSSCNDSSSNTEQQGKEYTSAYVCPMHCEGSGSEEEGNCPICGMNYVMNEDHTADGHQHN
jgi:hypothetical protein